jgi:DNA-binding transcriptional regulator LsrR (DeoR family)
MNARERDQLQKISRLYYLRGLNQKDIARRLNVSIAMVSRSLTRARTEGIVEIRIHSDAESYTDLELAIEQHYEIRECVITPAGEGGEPDARDWAAALDDVLPRLMPRGGLLGVSWGETLRSVGESLALNSTLEPGVVPVVGAMGAEETGIYPNSIARTWADRLGGRAYLVNSPALVDSAATAQQLLADSSFERIRDLWNRIDCAVVGTSGLAPSASIRSQHVLPAAELDALAEQGAVAVMNFLFARADGSILTTPVSQRLITLSEEQTRKVPTVVVIAGGPDKQGPLRAVLRSGLADVLVTDAVTAEALVTISDR